MKIRKSHPRYISLTTREQIVKGAEIGITSLAGLTAHGRGEAFDYLLGEKTHSFAKEAIEAAAALLLLAKYPVISVNGNTAALCAKELITLAKLLDAPLEVNLFHTSGKREKNIKQYLLSRGAKTVLLPSRKYAIKYISSNRKFVNNNGILKADVVFVPLEDGDRTEALIKNGKKVITIDLNPLSRTSQKATITIVDNIIRTLPLLIEEIKKLKAQYSSNKVRSISSLRQSADRTINQFDNKKILQRAISQIKS